VKAKFTRKQKYIHATKVIVLSSVLLPVYAGLLGLGFVLRTGLKVCGVSQDPPEC